MSKDVIKGHFRKYQEGRAGAFKPGNLLTIIEDLGDTLRVENKNGAQESIMRNEISISTSNPSRVSADEAQAALPKVDSNDGDKQYMEMLKLTERTGGLQLSQDIESRLTDNHEDPVEVAKELLNTSEVNQFKFAGVLAYICYYRTYQEHGYDSNNRPYTFRSFCSEKFNIGSSQSYDLAKMYVKFHTFGLTEADFVELGVSKSKALALALSDANKDMLIQNVHTMSVDTFKKFVRTLKVTGIEKMEGEVEGEKVQTTEYKFRLFGDQKSTFEEAMELAAQVIPEYADKPTFLLNHILSEWIDAQSSKATTLGTIDTEINFLRGQFKEYNIEYSEKVTNTYSRPATEENLPQEAVLV